MLNTSVSSPIVSDVLLFCLCHTNKVVHTPKSLSIVSFDTIHPLSALHSSMKNTITRMKDDDDDDTGELSSIRRICLRSGRRECFSRGICNTVTWSGQMRNFIGSSGRDIPGVREQDALNVTLWFGSIAGYDINNDNARVTHVAIKQNVEYSTTTAISRGESREFSIY